MEKNYTVKDLINKLKTLDESLVVFHEGCDCWGKWNGEIEITDDEGEYCILINRY